MGYVILNRWCSCVWHWSFLFWISAFKKALFSLSLSSPKEREAKRKGRSEATLNVGAQANLVQADVPGRAGGTVTQEGFQTGLARRLAGWTSEVVVWQTEIRTMAVTVTLARGEGGCRLFLVSFLLDS